MLERTGNAQFRIEFFERFWKIGLIFMFRCIVISSPLNISVMSDWWSKSDITRPCPPPHNHPFQQKGDQSAATLLLKGELYPKKSYVRYLKSNSGVWNKSTSTSKIRSKTKSKAKNFCNFMFNLKSYTELKRLHFMAFWKLSRIYQWKLCYQIGSYIFQ